MNATCFSVFVCLMGFPSIVLAQKADTIVRRELFDPLDRNKAITPGGPKDAPMHPPGGKCGIRSPAGDGAAHVEAVETAAKSRATGLRGYVEVETMQRDEEAGVEFLVEFVNEGSNAMELDDVTNKLNIVLFRMFIPEGLPAGHVIPSWSFHRFGAPVYSTEFPDEDEVREEAQAAKKVSEKGRPYGIFEPARRSPKVRTLRHIRDTGDVHLEPGERFQMVFRIAEGLADPAEYWWNRAEMSKVMNSSKLPPTEPSDLAPLSAGNYSLSLSLGVSVSVQSPDDTAVVRHHPILFCDAIKIRLGDVPEADGD